MEERKGGRESGYRPAFIEVAHRRCANGWVLRELADEFEIEPRTLNVWRKAHPALDEAIRAGRKEAKRRREAGGLKPRRRGPIQPRRYSRMEIILVGP